jgi:putative nucleotidyltransferase with HDIG domain
MKDLREIIKGIEDLTPVPHVVNQVLATAQDPKSSMRDIADVIVYDSVMTVNMIKICNSAYFGFSREINSIHDAIVLLGLDQVIEMFLFQCAFENLNNSQEGYSLSEGQLLKQSIATAMISKTIAEMLDIKDKHMVFTAALLKDIGKLVLGRFVATSLDDINHLVENNHMSFIEAEKAVLGIDHAELGGLIAENWHFSEKMIYIIRHHHLQDPPARKNIQTAIVYLAGAICKRMGVCAESDGTSYDFYDEIVSLFSFEEKDVDVVIQVFDEKKGKIEAFVQME